MQDVLYQQNCTLLKTSFSYLIKHWHYVNSDSGIVCATSVNVLILNGILFVLLIRQITII